MNIDTNQYVANELIDIVMGVYMNAKLLQIVFRQSITITNFRQASRTGNTQIIVA